MLLDCDTLMTFLVDINVKLKFKLGDSIIRHATLIDSRMTSMLSKEPYILELETQANLLRDRVFHILSKIHSVAEATL